MRKIYYGITLILSFFVILTIFVFPIYRLDEEKIYNLYEDEIQLEINKEINELLDEGLINTNEVDLKKEELKRSQINNIIYKTYIALNMYSANMQDVTYDEENNKIQKYDITGAIIFKIDSLKKHGVKFIDLVNGVANQVQFNIKLQKLIKEIKGAPDREIYRENATNPLPLLMPCICVFIVFLINIIMFVFSMMGISEKAFNNFMYLSIGALVCSILVLIVPLLIHATENPITTTSTLELGRMFMSCISYKKTAIIMLVVSIIDVAIWMIDKFVKNKALS